MTSACRFGRHVLAEHRQLGVAVAAADVAEHLVVAAVLAHHEEDVLDRPVGAQRCVRGGRLRVARVDLRARPGGEPLDDLASEGSRHQARAAAITRAEVRGPADRAEDVGRRRERVEGPEDGVGGDASGSVPRGVGADADALARRRTGAGRRALALGRGGDHGLGLPRPSGCAPPGSSRARACGVAAGRRMTAISSAPDSATNSRAPSGTERQRHRHRAQAGAASHRDRALDGSLRRSTTTTWSQGRERDVGTCPARVDDDALGVRERGADGDVA